MLRNQSILASLAYPAEYRSSGVMTFIVNQKGVIYQRSGRKTPDIAAQMNAYEIDNNLEASEIVLGNCLWSVLLNLEIQSAGLIGISDGRKTYVCRWHFIFN